jgi:hypothetical protein
MKVHEVVETLRSQAPFPIDRRALVDLLEVSTVVRLEDTYMAGSIRVLSVDGVILVQEHTADGKTLIRRMTSFEEADEFVDRRLARYERMWDGCGCKIDYFG